MILVILVLMSEHMWKFIFLEMMRKDFILIDGRNVSIITDAEGNKIVLINDIVFKGKHVIDYRYLAKFL